ncbi:MAG TPA: cystathionine beta-lyase [Pyrinomonadaceae bacterium]|jgi:cystathionine beta-lyase
MKTATRCVHLGDQDNPHGASVPPIYQTATFRQSSATETGEFDYTRSGNPTRRLLERQIAALEGGTHACAFASGMAALTALTRLVRQGDEIIAGDDLYGGTVRLLEQILPRQGIDVRYVDTTDAAAARYKFSERTKLILIETPTNPFLRITNLREFAQLARENRAILAVDNSMLSPLLQRPLELGADIVIHSATKFLCGHSDVIAGAVITNDSMLHQQIVFHQNAEGAGLNPFDSWLLLRGIKTLAIRVERQNITALRVAQYLDRHPLIERVYYPGLEIHEGYDVHRRQAEGGGAVISFTTNDSAFSKRLVEATCLFEIAVSFGSVSSTISLPCAMSHASIPAQLRSRLAPPPDLVRLSVGIEDVDDLIADLDQAIAAASGER